ncbi:Crp/Fnr family transcriptional regulator [Ponticoccus sp. SC2-23]|uniref:Crp/Fnr family transcriptional regulator n=1 Tax=Alexandriicola marinus TaxID=2081710 RepID=UPI000FDC251E|nr:Crp/Fnr family transcriptional regulator [Alexandriicola marinus]MBM1219290.1 Crp/Fnr family transcriptional regulator [Ponticoccus sp. SC6-9]MBM1223638.1 Crp/Fnr family transcriptional regulator [Ponticoccus sp. SC6-15]MBM1229103.1 Crp/Fnr family transcriptional regulator [Ponticoccus sp. SC6-38]MBM1232604.1 Crp/Fnr family transcriptional regulator [Ponticoccus sp. SC6-45]MBM1237446.1 Crp/Fnr family transcriptional regulator [Ponticoccus sp. SC6-49]MBM1241615.1 Crp/Fnr family transcriptio
MNWTDRVPAFASLEPGDRSMLEDLGVMALPRGAIVFRPGDSVQGYALVLSGRIDVSLTGPTGREIMLYSVAPGQSCIQTTLGLLAGDDYSAEAVASVETEMVLVPRALFLSLVDGSAAFRALVFAAFADRMQTMMQLLEKVAFQKVETRLAERLLALAPENGTIHLTHADLAGQVGSAREVVSRRLERWARSGWVSVGRGTITVQDRAALSALASDGL